MHSPTWRKENIVYPGCLSYSCLYTVVFTLPLWIYHSNYMLVKRLARVKVLYGRSFNTLPTQSVALASRNALFKTKYFKLYVDFGHGHENSNENYFPYMRTCKSLHQPIYAFISLFYALCPPFVPCLTYKHSQSCSCFFPPES